MNGDVGWFTIQPDQMQTLDAVLVLLFIPLFESIVYPFLGKLKLLKSPFQRLVVGGFLAAFAFLLSGGLELIIQLDNPSLPGSGHAEIILYNSISCPAEVHVFSDKALLPSQDFLHLKKISPEPVYVAISTKCAGNWSGIIDLKEKEIFSFMLLNKDNKLSLNRLDMAEGNMEMVRSNSSSPKLKFHFGVNV